MPTAYVAPNQTPIAFANAEAWAALRDGRRPCVGDARAGAMRFGVSLPLREEYEIVDNVGIGSLCGSFIDQTIHEGGGAK